MSMDHLPIRPDERPETAGGLDLPPRCKEHDPAELPTPSEQPEKSVEDKSWPNSGFGSFP
jgi:hypothetical protein